ncbi:MAG: glutathione S-transferase family protein [Hydrogenophaga sp.]|uniref:glutathione S-transferase family protein n=1 Tax=Hydrogenophaga sp. TaxID=1904254 RepID=UPI00261D9433|nr:glutathione S-transferase family protein [Hydrogenophaga sp.]MCV0437881.1 glutathione S-transferase family protein [Hydrogenophaga sp.]
MSSLRLYHHPISTSSRPVMMFVAEHHLRIDHRVVDLFSGEQHGPAFTAINPNQAVPVLEHGSFRLTESSAILKYLADLAKSDAYPADMQKRARVNEAMDWFNTGLSRELAYGFAYPQLFPNHGRPGAQAQADGLAWARPRAERLLSILDASMIGPDRRFVLSERITLADYLGLGIVTVGEAAGMDFAPWPNLRRWLSTMKARPAYAQTHAIFTDAFGHAQTRSAMALTGEGAC